MITSFFRNQRAFLLASLLLFLVGCTKMEPTESGVVFRMLPPSLGGGVSTNIIHQGQLKFLWPWERVYRFDTATQDISFGGGKGANVGQSLSARANDGNEVALSITVAYRVLPNSETLTKLVQEVATDNDGIQRLVVTLARSTTRSAMNELGTFEFRQVKARYEAIDKIKEDLNRILLPWGVEVVKVTLDDFQFARITTEGKVDSTYQEKINLIQQLIEDTKRELSKKETVIAQKQQELETEQGIFDRKQEEAIGYRDQAQARGDAYFESKSNQAKSILATGKAEVEGIVAQINALKGEGGRAVLRLEIGRRILENLPQFVVLHDSKDGSGAAAGLELKRLDINELLSQMAIVEGARNTARTSSGSSIPTPLSASTTAGASSSGSSGPAMANVPLNEGPTKAVQEATTK